MQQTENMLCPIQPADSKQGAKEVRCLSSDNNNWWKKRRDTFHTKKIKERTDTTQI
jgi:hypothetical protein